VFHYFDILVFIFLEKVNRQIDKLTNRQIGKSTNRQIGKSANWQIAKLANRKFGGKNI